jgi:predicted nucleotidyltransferase
MLSKETILSYLKDIKSTLKKDGIDEIGLFGSFAKDSADLYSDVDIVINTNKYFVNKYRGIDAFIYLDELRENLKKTFKREVDICDKSGLKNYNIIKEAIYI